MSSDRTGHGCGDVFGQIATSQDFFPVNPAAHVAMLKVLRPASTICASICLSSLCHGRYLGAEIPERKLGHQRVEVAIYGVDFVTSENAREHDRSLAPHDAGDVCNWGTERNALKDFTRGRLMVRNVSFEVFHLSSPL
jgi:hypothetical protein